MCENIKNRILYLTLVLFVSLLSTLNAQSIIGTAKGTAGETYEYYLNGSINYSKYNRWEVIGGTIVSGSNSNTSSINVKWNYGTWGYITLEYTDYYGSQKFVELDVTVKTLPAPSIGTITDPTSSVYTGSVVLNNLPSTSTWVINPGNISGSGTSKTVSNLSPGLYYFSVTDFWGYTSSKSQAVYINNPPLIPAAPVLGTITQPNITTPTGSVVLSGLPSTGSWVINPGSISGSGTTKTISGLIPGSYNFTVTNYYGYPSTASASVLISSYCGPSNQNYVHSITPTTKTTDIANLNKKQKIESIIYFDGLGRAKQKIGIRAGEVVDKVTDSIVFNDIITHIGYDVFGRQDKDYLPYEDGNNCGAFRIGDIDALTKSFYNVSKYENTSSPYSAKQFEASPLNRVLKQAAPGNDWKLDSGHEIKLEYQTNLANEVKCFDVSLSFTANTYTPTLIQSTLNSGFYPANELYKTVTYDENTTATPTELNGSTIEFKNKQGQVVLKRTYGTVELGITNEKYDTYYVYDDYGNLTYVLPPKMEPTTATIATINSQLNDLGYQYKYDQRNRLVEKKLPGKQWEFIVYDKLDRVVATGPALSPFNDTAAGVVGWMITKYDVFSRSVYTGWEQSTTVTSDGRITKQNNQNVATVFNESKQASGTIDGITAYYSNNIEPTSFKLLTVNYYDNYTFPGVASIPSAVETQNVLTTSAEVKGLATGSWIRIPTTISGTQSEIATTFYDKKARPIRTYLTNFLEGYTYTDSKLDFTGKPIYTITRHKRLSGSTELKTKVAFTYSPQGRLLSQTHQIGTGAIELIASNEYDKLGQLISKEVGGNIQKIDYTYNIRGWLKGINDVNAMGTDLFAFKISYNTPSAGISGVNGLYNGNIAETQWANKSDNGIVRTYGYKYDNLNRLREGIYQKVGTNNVTVLNGYNESMDYDKNGNIKHLKRYGSLNDTTPTLIDNLTYNYGNISSTTNTSNQLTSVDDAVANNLSFANEFKNVAGTDYSYDANGNMLRDANKGISTDIIYNHLNLPTKITFGTAGNIVYIYNAVGQKVQKVFTQGSTITTTDYLGGYQYKNTLLKFFPTTEGYVEPNGSSYKYVYQYKDHLGNVRLSYDKTLAVQEENDYYPFGLKHTGYGYSQVVNSDYKFKYNGKELQDELGLNMYDYGARNYDPALGRWMNIDPLAEKGRRWSPYNYAMDNPMFFVDPDGRWPFPSWATVKSSYDETKKYISNQSAKVVNWVKNHAVVQVEAKASVGVQVGVKTPFGSAGAGIITTDIGKVGASNTKGAYAKVGDGKGHNFAEANVKVIDKKLGVGAKVDWVNDTALPNGNGNGSNGNTDLLKASSYQGKLEWETNVGPGKNGPGFSDGISGDISVPAVKYKATTGNKEDCASCIETSFGAKAVLGVEVKIKIGYKE